MPKAKAATADTIDIDTADIPPTKYTPTETINTTPPEGQYITTESFTDVQHTSKQPHTLDAIDNQTETPPDKNLQHIQALEDAMAAIDQKIIVAEDRLAMLKSQKKDVKEQYLDAIKKEPTLYKSKLQNSFGF